MRHARRLREENRIWLYLGFRRVCVQILRTQAVMGGVVLIQVRILESFTLEGIVKDVLPAHARAREMGTKGSSSLLAVNDFDGRNCLGWNHQARYNLRRSRSPNNRHHDVHSSGMAR